MNDSYTIKDIISLLLSKLWLLILLAVIGGGGAFAYAHFMMPNQYQSYTSMYVRNSGNILGDLDINISALNASRSLLDTYTVVLKSNYVMGEVAERLEMEYTTDELAGVFAMNDGKISLSSLRNKITMSSVDETEVMKITANTTNPEISAAICNQIAESAEECLTRIVGAGSVEVIDVAESVYKPVSPNKPKMALIGAMAGLILAAFIVLMIDFFDNSVRSSEMLTTKYEKAVFGEIVNFSDGNSKKVQSEHRTILDEKMDFNIVENYKSIRSNIMFAFSTMPRKILAVSSANPGEGKSTTASNIAIAFAQMESKVLLIDADMRKPVQHKVFELSNKKGLSTAIGHMNPLEESVHKGVYKHLDVMPSGPIPPNPSEMLASQQFSDILDELEPQYDYIIIDTPPINVVSDTLVMGKILSGLLLVVKYGQTTFEELQDAINHANLSELNVIGFVVNNISRKGSGHYYSYKYKYKYRYKSYEYHYVSHSEDSMTSTPKLSMREDAPQEVPAETKAVETTAPIEETPAEVVEESAPIEETPAEVVEESAPIEETPAEVVEESAPIEETPAEVVEESAPIEETPAEIVEESAPIEETPAEVVEESAPIEETPAEVVEESAPIEETPAEVVEESAPIEETPAELLEAENLLEEIPLQDAEEAPVKSAIEEAPVALTEETAVEESSEQADIETTKVDLSKESDKKESE